MIHSMCLTLVAIANIFVKVSNNQTSGALPNRLNNYSRGSVLSKLGLLVFQNLLVHFPF